MSLAEALAAGGAQVRFLLPEDSLPDAVERATAAGCPVSVGNWRLEAVLAAAGNAGLVVVDSYRVTGSWLSELRCALAASGGALAVVDDLADRSFEADLVVNQNAGAERLRYPGAGRVLAGPAYALLRPEFAAHREQAVRALAGLPDVPGRVLVLFGGTDASGMTRTAALAAARAFPDAEIRAVAPRGIEPAVAGLSERITALPPVDAIHEEMLRADLVVSAAGTTLWELCCLARPTAVVAVAGNQVAGYDRLAELRAILPAGREPVRDPEVLADRLRDLVAPPGALRAIAAAAAELTDGHGADRVTDALAELAGADRAAEEVRGS
jgi:spore coat polysaccharide biosynthesis predicted glycosyltransferase SpsG